MKLAVLILCGLAFGCRTTAPTPDPSLFPNKSQDWHDGFKKGFHEGLIWNSYTTNAP